MLFRAPENNPSIRIGLTTGHIAIIEHENEGPHAPWRELPAHMHAEALGAGCICEQGQARGLIQAKPQAPAQNSAQAINQTAGPDDEIRKALMVMLERDQEGDFNKDKLPLVAAVSKQAGFTARKEDVMRVFRQMMAEAAVPVAGGEPDPSTAGKA